MLNSNNLEKDRKLESSQMSPLIAGLVQFSNSLLSGFGLIDKNHKSFLFLITCKQLTLMNFYIIVSMINEGCNFTSKVRTAVKKTCFSVCKVFIAKLRFDSIRFLMLSKSLNLSTKKFCPKIVPKNLFRLQHQIQHNVETVGVVFQTVTMQVLISKHTHQKKSHDLTLSIFFVVQRIRAMRFFCATNIISR